MAKFKVINHNGGIGGEFDKESDAMQFAKRKGWKISRPSSSSAKKKPKKAPKKSKK